MRPLVRAGGVAAVLALLACGEHGARIVDREGRRLAELSKPSDATSFQYSVARRIGLGYEASWSFETASEWPQYRTWLLDRLSELEPTAATASSQAFARWRGGDSYLLTFETAVKTHLEVRATLTVRPD